MAKSTNVVTYIRVRKAKEGQKICLDLWNGNQYDNVVATDNVNDLLKSFCRLVGVEMPILGLKDEVDIVDLGDPNENNIFS